MERLSTSKSRLTTLFSVAEREVLQMAAEGRSNLEISQRLFISPRTAETHRANLMRKLGLHSQADLVRFAARHGIVRFD